LDPDSKDVLVVLHVDTDGDVSGLVAHVRAVMDLDHKSVQIDH